MRSAALGLPLPWSVLLLPLNGSALDLMFALDSPASQYQSEQFRRKAPFRLQIECSGECSADCSYCYGRLATGEPLSTKEIKGLLRRAVALGVRQVDWMGGDPMERPDWIELLQAARYAGMSNNLWTSGPLLNNIGRAKWAIDLTREGYIMVHLDSLDPNVLRSIRSKYDPATVQDTLKGIELLLEMGKPPTDIGNMLMFTSMQGLADVRRTMTDLHQRYGIRTCLMSLKPVDESGRNSALLPAPETVAAAYRVRDDLFLSNRSMGCQDFPREYCGTTLFISLDGRVSSCYSLRRKLGSVREQSLEDIVAAASSSLFFTGFRDHEDTEVGCSCDEHLCWGCRANAYYFGGGSYQRDPICSSNPPYTNSVPY